MVFIELYNLMKLLFSIIFCLFLFNTHAFTKEVDDLIGKNVKFTFSSGVSCSYNFHKNGEVDSDCIKEGLIQYKLIESDDLKYITFGPSTIKGKDYTIAIFYDVEDKITLNFSVLPNEENAQWMKIRNEFEITEIVKKENISNELDKDTLEEIKVYYVESCVKEAPKKLCECIFDNHVIYYPEKDKFLNTDVAFNYLKENNLNAPEISIEDMEGLLEPMMEIMGICYSS